MKVVNVIFVDNTQNDNWKPSKRPQAPQEMSDRHRQLRTAWSIRANLSRHSYIGAYRIAALREGFSTIRNNASMSYAAPMMGWHLLWFFMISVKPQGPGADAFIVVDSSGKEGVPAS